MKPETEIPKNSEEICVHVIGVKLPAEFGGFAGEVVDAIARAVDRTFNPWIIACLKESTLIIDIYHQYVPVIETCNFGCEMAAKVLGCGDKSYIEVCYKNCREAVRQESYDALEKSIVSIKRELKLMRLKYMLEIDKESPPQHVKFVIKL